MNEQNGQPPGPSNETLKHLAGMLPSFAQGIAEKKAIGKGRKEVPRGPRKVCPVCGHGHDTGPIETKVLPEAVTCRTCQNDLDAGYTAFIAGDRYVISKSARLADMAGKIIKISPHVLERLSKEFELEWKVKANGSDQAPTGELSAGDSGAV